MFFTFFFNLFINNLGLAFILAIIQGDIISVKLCLQDIGRK